MEKNYESDWTRTLPLRGGRFAVNRQWALSGMGKIVHRDLKPELVHHER